MKWSRVVLKKVHKKYSYSLNIKENIMTEHEVIKIRLVNVDDLKQLCSVRNNEELFLGYLD